VKNQKETAENSIVNAETKAYPFNADGISDCLYYATRILPQIEENLVSIICIMD